MSKTLEVLFMAQTLAQVVVCVNRIGIQRN
jgi:hypothetical protein